MTGRKIKTPKATGKITQASAAKAVKAVMEMKKKFPSTIRVGYRHYTVVEWDHQEAHGDGAFGTHSYGMARIRVSADLDPEKKANTLMHEIFHACYDQAAMGDGASEEDVVTSLANVFCQIWQDNPKVIAYLDSALAK